MTYLRLRSQAASFPEFRLNFSGQVVAFHPHYGPRIDAEEENKESQRFQISHIISSGDKGRFFIVGFHFTCNKDTLEAN